MLGAIDGEATEALLDATSLLALALLTAGLAGALAGWLASTLAMPRPAADAVARLSDRLGEQADALARAEAASLDQLERAEAGRHRMRGQMADVAGLLQRLAKAQSKTEAAAEARTRAILQRAARRERGLIAGVKQLDRRLTALEARVSQLARTEPATQPPVTPEALPLAVPQAADMPGRSVQDPVPAAGEGPHWPQTAALDPLDLPDRVVAMLTR